MKTIVIISMIILLLCLIVPLMALLSACEPQKEQIKESEVEYITFTFYHNDGSVENFKAVKGVKFIDSFPEAENIINNNPRWNYLWEYKWWTATDQGIGNTECELSPNIYFMQDTEFYHAKSSSADILEQ